MKITDVYLENWMPFGGSTALEKLPSGAIGVVARYEENARRSNWAGKTSLLEAIEWCLFGVHRKRYEDDLITHGADRTSVTVCLDGVAEVTRARVRGQSSKLTLRTSGGNEFKGDAAESEILDALGFDGADYRATLCFAQGDTEAIVARTSGERRKIVAEWLELDSWIRVAARARARARECAEKVRQIQNDIAMRSGSIREGVDQELESRIQTARAKLLEIRTEIETIEKRLEGAADWELTRQDVLRVEALRREAASLKAEIGGQGVNPEELAALREKAGTERAEMEKSANALQDARKLAGGDFDGRCPVTCGSCPVADSIRSDRAAGAEKLRIARLDHGRTDGAYRETAAALREMESRERDLVRKRERFNGIVEEGRRLNAAIDARGNNAQIGITDQALAELKRRKSELVALEREVERDGRNAQHEQATIVDLREFIARRSKELEAAEKESRVANFAAVATGPTGIPAAIAESSLHALEERANTVLAGSGLSFRFAWDRATKDLTPTCDECGFAYKGQRDKACPACKATRGPKRADELEILVTDGSGVEEDVRAKSGGAKVLVGSAIRLAAGLMLRDRRGARCAWATVDEPFGALDEENRENLARTFAGLLGAVGLEQAFVVSHDAALLDALPSTIEIVRSGDKSVARLVR